MITMAIMAIMSKIGDYGHFCHNPHFCHNDHISLIWVSIEAYGLPESSPSLQNPQIQKGKKQTDDILPLAQTVFNPDI